MLMSPVVFKSEKGCAGDVQQKLKTADQSSSQRGHPTSTNPKLSKNNFKKVEKLDVGPRWLPDTKTDWPTVGRNITLTLTTGCFCHNIIIAECCGDT
jgi:hypothetical protein